MKRHSVVMIDEDTKRKLRLKAGKLNTTMAGAIRKMVNDEVLEDKPKRNKFDFKW